MKNWRKVIMAAAGLAVLLTAFLVGLHFGTAAALWPVFVGGVIALVATGVGGNVAEHLAAKAASKVDPAS
jgi:hypothetical protein